jgi:hypothetical protein
MGVKELPRCRGGKRNACREPQELRIAMVTSIEPSYHDRRGQEAPGRLTFQYESIMINRRSADARADGIGPQ